MPNSETVPNAEHQADTSVGNRRAGFRPPSLALGRADASLRVPVISRPLLRWFTWYARRYLRRHFHSLRISRAGLPAESCGLPLVLYSNHASWWDALVCLVVKQEFFPGRSAFAPMDAAMLDRYKMFGKFGFFGVSKNARHGAQQFLRTAKAILKSPGHVLFVTPQSRFADVRERPVRFEAGLGHLALRAEHALFVPVVAEYVFWEERLPEILVRFGEPVEVRAGCRAEFGEQEWTALFERKLTETQDALAVEAQRRHGHDFQIVLQGGAGQGGVYDWWRALKAKCRGESFCAQHGNK